MAEFQPFLKKKWKKNTKFIKFVIHYFWEIDLTASFIILESAYDYWIVEIFEDSIFEIESIHQFFQGRIQKIYKGCKN